MYLIGVVVLCALTCVHAEWLQELTLGRGLELGSGISLHLDRLNRENASLLERHALRVDYSGMGLSLGKALNKDALQLGLYVKDDVVEEGRGKKVGELLVPAIIGFKTTGVAIMVFTVVMLLVFKALAVAKLAALTSVGLLIAKHLHFKPNPYMEFEHMPHHPVYAEYPSATGYSPSGSANYLTFANYGTSEVSQGSETMGQYTVIEAPTANSTSTGIVSANKRQDGLRRRPQPVPIITVRKYSIEH